ncbi:cold shock domain-containing protein 3-like [Dendronephthya gigantea]|uniref:cold shock domain-containing protein 3-like n=1 Tax=Dendronephthya gigantea TaxID=151771 RepID=UPI00106BBDC3|nr:cold shock domain-containing protein 3-like [Dendronephthya gigantea]
MFKLEFKSFEVLNTSCCIHIAPILSTNQISNLFRALFDLHIFYSFHISEKHDYKAEKKLKESGMATDSEKLQGSGRDTEENEATISEGGMDLETDDMDKKNDKNVPLFEGKCHHCSLKGHKAFQCTEDKKIRNDFKGSCYNCGLKGHKARECRKSYNRDGNKRKCFKCGKVGHLAKACRSKSSNIKPTLKHILQNCTSCTMNFSASTLPNKD